MKCNRSILWCISFIILSILIFFSACVPEKNETLIDKETGVLEAISIKMELEDNVYKYNGQWYRWNDRVYENCSPDFFAAYSSQEKTLELRYCKSLGKLMDDGFELNNGSCEGGIIDVTMDDTGAVVHYYITVSEDFNFCLLEYDDVFDLGFTFNFYQ